MNYFWKSWSAKISRATIAAVSYVALVGGLAASTGKAEAQSTVSFQYQGPGQYTGVDDSQVAYEAPNGSYGGQSTFTVGGRYGAYKGLLRFDIRSLQNSFTSIVGAKLKLKLNLKRGTWASQSFNLYRISAANKGWAPGTATSPTVPQNGAACWNYLSYNSVVDPVTGQLTGTTWAGSAGLSTAATDYVTTQVASGIISSTAPDASLVTLTFTDLSFFSDWINNPNNNAGFLLRCPGLETQSYSYVSFNSSEAVAIADRPLLELTVNGYVPPPSWDIQYNLAQASRVSLVVYDSSGNVVRELLHAASRPAGTNIEHWDGRDESGALAPNGTYSWKLLSTQGIVATYQLTVGTNPPVKYDTWPGNHAPVTCVAVDSTGTYLAGGESEGPPLLIKIDSSGNRIWTANMQWVEAWMGGWSLSADNGKLYMCQQNGKMQVFNASTAPSNPTATFNLLYASGDPSDPDVGQRYTMDSCVRGGKMVVSYQDHDAIRWINATNGSTLQEIAVSDPTGVTLTSDGATAYVCSGTSILTYTYPSTTPTTFKTFGGSVVPFRIDVDPRNGDLMIAFRGTDQKVRRYSSTGTALAVYGTTNGRARNGAYNRNGFVDMNDMTVAPDGSWWITEPTAAPLRTAHFNTNGTFDREFYGGFSYAPHAAPDPEMPSSVWLNKGSQELVQTNVDYTNKTWSVGAVYSIEGPLMPRFSFANQGWQVLHRNNKTYLCSRRWPIVFRLEGSMLKPCAIAGIASDGSGNWRIPANLRPATGSPRMFAWSDLNDDGVATLGEMTFDTRNIGEFSQTGAYSHIDSDFAYTGIFSTGYASTQGPGRMAPTSWTAGGAPVYSWSALTYPTNGFPAGMKHEIGGFWKDSGGNYYGAYNTEWGAIGGTTFGSGFWSNRVGGNKIVKWNSSGNRQWMVGRHSPTGGALPGEMRYLWSNAGSAKDCIFTMDVEQNLIHIYDRDGLYVGRVLESHTDGLPEEAYTLCGENFSGAVYENAAGEVLYFGGAVNRSHIYKLTGWDSFGRQNGTVVKN